MLLSLAGGGEPYVPKPTNASKAAKQKKSKLRPPKKITYFYSRRNGHAAGRATPIGTRNQRNTGKTPISDVVQTARWIKQVPKHAHDIRHRESSVATKENSDTTREDVSFTPAPRTGSPHFAGKHSELGPPGPLRQIGNTDIILHEDSKLRKITPHHASVFSIPDSLRPEEEEDERERIRREARRASNELLVAAAAHTAAARRAHSPQSKLRTSVHASGKAAENALDPKQQQEEGNPSAKSTVKKKKRSRKKKQSGAQPKVSEKELKLGGQVEVEARGKEQLAVVRYVGPTHFLQGVVWVGLELAQPIGLNDGSVEGVRYFKCQDKYGVFVRLDAVLRIVGEDFWVGSRVTVKRSLDRILPGTVQYIGTTDFGDGEWVGVALDQPDKGNDGKVGLRRYFKCAEECGVFSRRWRIEVLKEDDGDQHGGRELDEAKVEDNQEPPSTEEYVEAEPKKVHKSPPATILKQPTPATVVKGRMSSPLQFEFSDEDDPMRLNSDNETATLDATEAAGEPVRIQELMPPEPHRRSLSSRRRSKQPEKSPENHPQPEPLQEHHRRRTPTPAHAQYQPHPDSPVDDETVGSDSESAPPPRHTRSPRRPHSSSSPHSSHRSKDRRSNSRHDPRYDHQYDDRSDPQYDPPSDPRYEPPADPWHEPRSESYRHSDPRYSEPRPSEFRRASPVPRNPYLEPLNMNYGSSKNTKPAPHERTPRGHDSGAGGSAKKSGRGGPGATPRRSTFTSPHVASPHPQTERTRRRKSPMSGDAWQQVRRARTPSPRRTRAQFPVEHPRTALRSARSTNADTDTWSKAASMPISGRNLPWEKKSRATTPLKSRRRVARSMSPGGERRTRRLSNSKATPKHTAHGRELPWSPHPRSKSPSRARSPGPARGTPTPSKMRIKDVREAREKAEQQMREEAEHEAKHQTERETRFEAERRGIEARRRDVELREAKQKAELAAQRKQEKAILKARQDAQKVAQTVRKSRRQAAKEEKEERERQEWVRREAEAKKAREQAEKAEQKAREEAQKLQEQLRQAQETVKRWEQAEAERRAREERERQETSAQKQRRLDRLAVQANQLVAQAEQDGIILGNSPVQDRRASPETKSQSPGLHESSPARQLSYSESGIMADELDNGGIMADESDNIGRITVHFTPNKSHVMSRQWMSASSKARPKAKTDSPNRTPSHATPLYTTSPAQKSFETTLPAQKSPYSKTAHREVPVIDAAPSPAQPSPRTESSHEHRRLEMVARLQHRRDSRLSQLQQQLASLTRVISLGLPTKALTNGPTFRDELEETVGYASSSVATRAPSQRLSLFEIHGRQEEIRQQLSEF